MGEEWEDGVVYVGAMNIFRCCGYSGETTETYIKPMRFWMACKLACQTAVPSDT